MIKVLLADDLEIVRSLMRCVHEKKGGMEVLGLASNGQEAVNEASTHCPDVARLDVSMPTMDGSEAAKQISEKCRNTRVLMGSMHHTSYHLERSMDAGASG